MTEDPALKAAVIGCGAIAYEHLPFLAQSPLCRLVAVCDRSEALALAAAERFGAEASFVDAQTMLATAKPDVVHVLTPPHTHVALVMAALAAGAHVICEKPLAGTEEETVALLQAARRAKRVLQESRNLLYNDPVLKIRDLVSGGQLGQVVECDILLSLNFLEGPFGDTNLSGPAVRLPGGAIHDFLPHLAYLFQVLTGESEVSSVCGKLENRSGNSRAKFDFLDALVEAGKVRGRLKIATDTAPAAFRIALRGTAATVETELYNPYFFWEGAPNTGKRAPVGRMTAGVRMIGNGLSGLRDKIMQHGTMHGLPRMLEDIYTALRHGAAPPFSEEDMLATARLTDRLIALGDERK